MAEPAEVIIDGVRYVPARQAVAGLKDLQTALEDEFWGEGYSQDKDRSEGLFIRVYDDGEGTPLGEFIDSLAAKLTRKTPPHA